MSQQCHSGVTERNTMLGNSRYLNRLELVDCFAEVEFQYQDVGMGDIESVGRLYQEVGIARVTIESTRFYIRTCWKHTCRESFILLGA